MSWSQAERRTVRVPAGTIHYREAGEGPAVVLVHGLLVDGSLWDAVATRLATEFRVVVPDWPLGSHPVAMDPGADLSPAGLAGTIADVLEALDLRDVTLVGNDTGGALCQLVATSRPERVDRLVLTPCDAYENFLPPRFRPLQWLTRSDAATRSVLTSLRWAPLQRLPMTLGALSRRDLPADLVERWLRPACTNAGVRRDLRSVLRGIDPALTREAAQRFAEFARPVLLAWAPEDRIFPIRHAEAMARAFPDARLERIEDSRTFVSLDQPARTADLIAAFAAAGAPQ